GHPRARAFAKTRPLRQTARAAIRQKRNNKKAAVRPPESTRPPPRRCEFRAEHATQPPPPESRTHMPKSSRRAAQTQGESHTTIQTTKSTERWRTRRSTPKRRSARGA